MTHIIQYCSKAFTTSSLVLVGAIALLSFLPTQDLAAEEGDVFTDIILINGQAELADFNADGEVLMRHTAVPDYFTSGRSHKRSLRNSLNKLKVYGNVEKPSPKTYHAPVECRQSLMAVQEIEMSVEDINSELTVLTALSDLADIINEDLSSDFGSTESIVYTVNHERTNLEKIRNRDLIFSLPKQRLEATRRLTAVYEADLLI